VIRSRVVMPGSRLARPRDHSGTTTMRAAPPGPEPDIVGRHRHHAAPSAWRERDRPEQRTAGERPRLSSLWYRRWLGVS
jgi:hypothetical protein